MPPGPAHHHRAPPQRRFITDAFFAGLPPADAATAADVLATAEEFGISTHGAAAGGYCGG
jgi:LDH2 family malate/lactate/ureidoglycolate dehydrogenase